MLENWFEFVCCYDEMEVYYFDEWWMRGVVSGW